MDRLAEEKARQAHAFFAHERGADRLRITSAEKKALLEGWVRRKQRLDREELGRGLSSEVESALQLERQPDAEPGRLAWTLLELKRRAGRLGGDRVREEKECMRVRRGLF